MKKLAVIGGGASGITAAIFAARHAKKLGIDIDITIYEKNDRIGKKLLATGNGKCNFSNANCSQNLIDSTVSHYHSDNTNAVKQIISAFDVQDSVKFFSDIGIMCTSVVNHKNGEQLYYPQSMRANTMLDFLRYEMDRLNILQNCDCEISEIKHSKNGYNIRNKNGKSFFADAVILTTGSSATHGSDSGFALLKSAGHKINTVYPALTQLKCNPEIVKSAKGMRCDATVTLKADEREIAYDKGEIQFCDYGLSGIPIMNISGFASKYFALSSKAKLTVTLDLFEQSADTLAEFMTHQQKSCSDLSCEDALGGIMNKQIAIAFLKNANICSPKCSFSSLSRKTIQQIAVGLKSWEIAITGVRGMQYAQVCGGGASLNDFCPNTLESKKADNLYACGEILDVYGDCGGYNLAFAWASAYVAGTSAVQKLLK